MGYLATGLPIKGQLQVRITDNVLNEDDWGTDFLVLRDGMVVRQLTLTEGGYTVPNMMGWTREQLIDWANEDTTGQHPEEYHEVDICL